MECLVGFSNVVVDVCPADYQPDANKAVMAFTTRHTFYLQSLLVYFNAAVAAGLLDEARAANKLHAEKKGKQAQVAWLRLRRKSGVETLNVLMAMIAAMTCTALVLGYSPKKSLDFHSALVVAYLIGFSWLSVALTVPVYNQLNVSLNDHFFKLIVVTVSGLVFGFIYSLLGYAEKFGRTFCCNSTAKVVIFGSFSALGKGGKVAGWFIVSSALLAFTGYTLYALYKYRSLSGQAKDTGPAVRNSGEELQMTDLEAGALATSPQVGRNGRTASLNDDDGVGSQDETELESETLVVEIAGPAQMKLFAVYFVVWIISIINVELLVYRNNFAYDIRDNIMLSMTNPVAFAQTLTFTDVLTFFIPFVHFHDTYLKILATYRHYRKTSGPSKQQVGGDDSAGPRER